MATKRPIGCPCGALFVIAMFGFTAVAWLRAAWGSGLSGNVRVFPLAIGCVTALFTAFILFFYVRDVARALRRSRHGCYKCGEPRGEKSHTWHIGGRQRKLCTTCHDKLEQEQESLMSEE